MTDYLDPHFVRALCHDPERRTLQVSKQYACSPLTSKFRREYRIKRRHVCWLCKSICPFGICIIYIYAYSAQYNLSLVNVRIVCVPVARLSRLSVKTYVHNGEKVKGWHLEAMLLLATFGTSTTFLLLCNQNNVFCTSFVEQILFYLKNKNPIIIKKDT